MKKIKKHLLSTLFISATLLSIPIVATSVVSCSSGASNDSGQSSQQKEFERLKNLEAVQSDYTPLIPDGILMKREGGSLKSVNEYHWINEDEMKVATQKVLCIIFDIVRQRMML